MTTRNLKKKFRKRSGSTKNTTLNREWMRRRVFCRMIYYCDVDGITFQLTMALGDRLANVATLSSISDRTLIFCSGTQQGVCWTKPWIIWGKTPAKPVAQTKLANAQPSGRQQEQFICPRLFFASITGPVLIRRSFTTPYPYTPQWNGPQMLSISRGLWYHTRTHKYMAVASDIDSTILLSSTTCFVYEIIWFSWSLVPTPNLS